MYPRLFSINSSRAKNHKWTFTQISVYTKMFFIKRPHQCAFLFLYIPVFLQFTNLFYFLVIHCTNKSRCTKAQFIFLLAKIDILQCYRKHLFWKLTCVGAWPTNIWIHLNNKQQQHRKYLSVFHRHSKSQVVVVVVFSFFLMPVFCKNEKIVRCIEKARSYVMLPFEVPLFVSHQVFDQSYNMVGVAVKIHQLDIYYKMV